MFKKVITRGPVAERLRVLFLDHSIISPLRLVGVRAPHWPREASQVLLAGVSGIFCLGSPVFVPSTDWSVSYELKYDYLERDVKQKKKNKKHYHRQVRVA